MPTTKSRKRRKTRLNSREYAPFKPKTPKYASFQQTKLEYAEYTYRHHKEKQVDLSDIFFEKSQSEEEIANPSVKRSSSENTVNVTSKPLEELRDEDLPQYTEEELTASICRDSFFDFVQEFWGEIVAEPLVLNWHIKFLCDELQELAERVFKGLPKLYDLIINIPPGTTKSTIASIMFPAWCWTRMAHCRVISASYAYPLAMDLSRKSRDVIKSEKFRRCYPAIQLTDVQDSKGYFVNTNNGYRFAVGTNGSVLGMHGHFIIIDDPLDPLQAISESELKTANYRIDETLFSRKVNKANTPVILIMQRLAEHDPSGSMLEKDKIRQAKGKSSRIRHICLPAEASARISPVELTSKYKEGLLDPIRLSKEVLEDAEAQGEYYYAGQFMQDPAPRGGGMFKIEQLKHDITLPRFKRVVRYWDKAATESNTAAYTVGVKMGLDMYDAVWVIDVIRGRWNSAKRERIILQTAYRDGYGCRVGIEQEPGSGGKEPAESTVRRLFGFSVEVNKVGKSDGDKEARADPFSTQVNAGNVVLLRAAWNDDYIEEMRYFPKSRYKDQIDASSGAFKMLERKPTIIGGL